MPANEELINVRWRKSKRSNTAPNQCVEVASLPGRIALRDSKNVTGPVVTVRRSVWHEVHDAIRSGELDF